MMRPLFTAFALLTTSAAGQVLHSGESIFTIAVRGGIGVQFRGSCLSQRSDGTSVSTELKGIVPAEFKIVGAAVFLTVQNKTGGKEPEIRVGSDGIAVLDPGSPGAQRGPWLEVELSKNGGSMKTQRTDAPFGVVSLGTAPAATGSAVRTELQVEGVRFALITFTSDTGDIEQQVVPVPFSQAFYPKAGAIVGITAQKTRVVRWDYSHPTPVVEVLYDGRAGEMVVTIRVNGLPLGTAKTSEAFGVASATVTIP